MPIRGRLFMVLTAGLTVLTPAVADASTGSGVQAVPSPGVYNLLNEERNLQCLAGRTNDVVSVSECVSEFTDQYWSLEPLPEPGHYRLRNRIDGRCLAMPRGDNGAEARMFECIDNYNDQWWRLDPTLLSDSFQLRNHKTGRCLVARRTNGRATQSDCVLSFKDQWWHFFAR